MPDYEAGALNNFKNDFINNFEYKERFISGNNFMFVAYDKNSIIGMICERGNGHIPMLFVDGNYHRKGIATALMKEMIIALKSQGFKIITLNSSPYGVPFYEHFGFKSTDNVKHMSGFIFTPMQYIIKNEKEKMLNGELYRVDEELTKERNQAQQLTFEYNQTSPLETDKRRKILEELLGSIGENVTIEAGFRYDYGKNISIGNNVFINFNLVALDCNKITIGDDVMIAPNVGIYTATHTVSPEIRKQALEYAEPITICNGVWIGGGVSILPGVTIGENSVIGAGSVVTKDIPPNVVACGNPCKVVKEIDE
ncbi:MAG: GNAT family N-acetyltransferase [Oscillospiraceae bacterium]|nr:GNAT family N-acetyltransferase [Oscillospiraceae bacterium]